MDVIAAASPGERLSSCAVSSTSPRDQRPEPLAGPGEPPNAQHETPQLETPQLETPQHEAAPQETPKARTPADARPAGDAGSDAPARGASARTPRPKAVLRRAGTLRTKQLTGLAAAAVLAVSALFGGLEEVAPDVPREDPGTTLSAAPFEVTVTRAASAPQLTEQIPASVYGRYVLVFAEVTNTSDEPVYTSTLQDLLQLDGVEGLLDSTGTLVSEGGDDRPQIYHALDSSRLSVVGPLMTYSIAFVWEQQERATAPTELTVWIAGHEHRLSSFDRSGQWDYSGIVATVDLPVAEWLPPEDET